VSTAAIYQNDRQQVLWEALFLRSMRTEGKWRAIKAPRTGIAAGAEHKKNFSLSPDCAKACFDI